MTKKNRLLRKHKLRAKQKKYLLRFAALVFAPLIVLFYTVSMLNNNLTTDTATLRPLLNLIASAESNANYNAYFGNASNDSLKLTEMPIEDVLEWQAEYVNQGNPSSAAGRYQIINTTLASLVEEFNVDKGQAFDKATQDKMAIALIERRGVTDYINKKLSAKEFAANLAKEWAALPRTVGKDPDSSYYASDGLNKSRVSTKTVLEAIKAIQPKR